MQQPGDPLLIKEDGMKMEEMPLHKLCPDLRKIPMKDIDRGDILTTKAYWMNCVVSYSNDSKSCKCSLVSL